MVIGTTAELIKMAPVYQELKSRNLTPEIWWTGMHNRDISKSFQEFDIELPSQYLGGKPGKDVESTKDAIVWFIQVVRNGIFHTRKFKALLRSQGKPIVLVHGDTFTTLIGSALGRIWKASVMHVEAGYRSGSLKSPFPEEFNRTIAAKFANVHFAPGAIQTENLKNETGVVINTQVNTAIDALRMISSGDPDSEFLSEEPYGVVTLHRFEFLSDEDLVLKTFNELKRVSKHLKLYYFAGSHDKHILQDLGLLNEVPSTLILRDKMEFRKFIPIVKNSSAIITDSGGLALEANFLGIPAMIHRQRTENPDGLGTTSMLSKLDVNLFEQFISGREAFRGPNLVDTHFPSKQIADFVAENT
jgi:UDP-N-acetylglucosamine 2-epimerase (non-hydrolysing)